MQNNEARRQLRELKDELDRIATSNPKIRTEADVRKAIGKDAGDEVTVVLEERLN